MTNMKQEHKIGLLAVAIVAGGMIVCGVVVGGVMVGRSLTGDAPIFRATPTDDMTVRDFVEMLDKKGAIKGHKEVSYMTFFAWPVALVYFPDNKALEVIQFDTRQKAKDMAAASPKPAISSGRFLVKGDANLIERLKGFVN